MRRELSLSYEVNERYGSWDVSLLIEDGENRRVIWSEFYYKKPSENAAWRIVTNALERALEDPQTP